MQAPWRALFLLALAVATPGYLLAQATAAKAPEKKADEEEQVNLSPFLVTGKKDIGYSTQQTTSGTRTAVDMLDLSSTIVVLNRQLIDDINPNDVYQLISVGVSGVTSTNNQDQFSFRGFVQAFQLRDGGYLRSYKGNSLYDMERIEVIKGPSALTFGNSSFLGGVINYISGKPSAVLKAQSKTTVSDRNYVREEAYVAGPGYKSKGFELRYRFAVGYENGDYERASYKDSERYGGASFDFQFGPNSLLNLSASVYNDPGYTGIDDFMDVVRSTTGVSGTVAATTKAVLNKYSTPKITAFSAGNKNIYWNNQDGQVTATFMTKLNDQTDLRFFGQRGENRMEYMLARWVLVRPDNHTVSRNVGGDEINTVFYNAQADFLHKIDGRFGETSWSNSILIGGDWNYLQIYAASVSFPNRFADLDTASPDYSADAAVFNTILTTVNPLTGLAYNGKGHMAEQLRTSANHQVNLNYSGYYQETFKFWNNRITLTTGQRLLYIHAQVRNMYPAAGIQRYTDYPDKRARPYKNGIIVKLLPDVTAYFSQSANTIPPITGILDEFGNRIPNREGILKEGGFKYNRSLTDRITVSGSILAFNMKSTNARINAVDPATGLSITTYSALDVSKGYELDLNGRVRLDGGYGDFIVTYTSITSRAANGIPIRRFPPKKYSMLGKYTWTSGPLKNFMIGASMVESNTGDFAGWLLDFPPVYNVFSRYTVNRHWSAQLNLNNITDERFITGIFNNALNSTNDSFRPRLSVTYNY